MSWTQNGTHRNPISTRRRRTAGDSLNCKGVEWELPGEYDRLRYYGPGPEETYRDRKQGGKLGIWDATAKASMAPPW